MIKKLQWATIVFAGVVFVALAGLVAVAASLGPTFEMGYRGCVG